MKSPRVIIIVVFMCLIALSALFVFTQYKETKNLIEKESLQRLSAIATTLALSIDGEQHQALTQRYTQKDDIKTSSEDSNYYKIHQLLKECKTRNNIKTDIYTLFFEDLDLKDRLYFGVTSGDIPNFRHQYNGYPETIKQQYVLGSTLKPYSNTKGQWMSAFAPIRDKNHLVTGIVQIDKQIDVFYDKIKIESSKLFVYAIIAVSILSLIFYLLFRAVLRDEEEKLHLVSLAHKETESQRKKIHDSIQYAQIIQNAIIPTFDLVEQKGVNIDMIYKAKDVVSGDLPWRHCVEDKILIASIDCTGHGVPGAMMSFVGYFLLNHTTNLKDFDPSNILTQLDIEVRKTLNQDDKNSLSQDGMDVSLLLIDKKTNTITYSGARRPLYRISNGELFIQKGVSKSIGGNSLEKLINRQFINHQYEYNIGDQYYIFSDGIPDQFGGEKNKKLGNKRLREMLQKNPNANVKSQIKYIEHSLNTWQGNNPQTDDMLMLGIELT